MNFVEKMKKQILIGLSLIIFGIIQAQETDNYIHFSVGGGEQHLNPTLAGGTTKAQPGFTVNVAYSHFFTSQWGVQFGVGAQSYTTLSTLNYLSVTPDVVDAVGDVYELRVNFKDWQEKQQALLVSVPVELQYRYVWSDRFSLLTGVGASVSIPVQANYKTVGGEMVSTGYYSKWNVELSDLPQHGFGTYTNSFSGKFSLSPVYMATGNLGGLFNLSEKLDLYVGGYIHYGLNNSIKASTKAVYEPAAVYNGFFNSDRMTKVTPIAFGVKLGIYWRLGEKYRDKTPEIEVMPVMPPGISSR